MTHNHTSRPLASDVNRYTQNRHLYSHIRRGEYRHQSRPSTHYVLQLPIQEVSLVRKRFVAVKSVFLQSLANYCLQNDRFIPEANESPMPLESSPRSRRFAHRIGVSNRHLLSFKRKTSESRLRPAPPTPTKQRALTMMR